MTKYSPAKTGEYLRIFPNFQICAHCEKDLKNNKDNSRHLGRKYARIFVLGHYPSLVALSFPQALLSENCSLLGTDNVRGQISEHIFAPNGDYCLYSVHPRKIPGWIVVICENYSLNKWGYRKEMIEIVLSEFLSVFCLRFYIFRLKWLSSKKNSRK